MPSSKAMREFRFNEYYIFGNLQMPRLKIKAKNGYKSIRKTSDHSATLCAF